MPWLGWVILGALVFIWLGLALVMGHEGRRKR